jgi:hypothetical protein
MTSYNNFCILTHTHSDCKDLYDLYFDSINTYFTKEIQHYVCVDEEISTDRSINQIIYKKNSLFADRILLALSQIKQDFILFSLEDYVLYDYVDQISLNEYLNFMSQNPIIGFIRLIQSGIVKDQQYPEYDKLVVLKKYSDYYFSTQITIWRKDLLIQLFESYKTQTVRDEIATSYELSKFDYIGMAVKRKGKSVGGHFDSLEYPYIATACVGGKWNVSEYPYITTLLNKYDIDISIRGYR